MTSEFPLPAEQPPEVRLLGDDCLTEVNLRRWLPSPVDPDTLIYFVASDNRRVFPVSQFRDNNKDQDLLIPDDHVLEFWHQYALPLEEDSVIDRFMLIVYLVESEDASTGERIIDALKSQDESTRNRVIEQFKRDSSVWRQQPS